MYLVIKRKKSFLFIKPLKPKKLKDYIIYLGASFIKLAQVLATRADFFSKDYLGELRNLHDKIPAMKKRDFEEIFKKSFHEEIFKKFQKEPMASASIGQVHYAILKNDKEVAVKLRRKGIKNQVLIDIKIIKKFNFIFRPLFSKYTKNSIEAVIGEFSKMIIEEVSLNQELQNLKNFRKIYKNEHVKFPKPYEKYSCDDALVMSFEHGFRFDDKENILRNKIKFKKAIRILVDFYTTQMLKNGFFHADPHPGNLLINKKGRLILLDFGMVKTVPNDKRIAIIELIKAANEQDFETYISASKRLGTIAYEAPMGELAQFTSKMFEIFSNDNLNSQSMQDLAFNVLESIRDLPFKLPSDAIYILRVSAIIEGLGTTYVENFNGVKDILPILQDNLPKALGAKDSILQTLIDEVKDIPFITKDFKSMIRKASQGFLEVEISKNQLNYIFETYQDLIKSLSISFSFILASIFYIFYQFQPKELAIILFLIGLIRIIYK